MVTRTSVGTAVRDARTEKGWSVKEFIKRMTADGTTKISPAYVTRVEQYGEIPSPEMLIRMSAVLDCDLDELVEAAKGGKIESFKSRIEAKYDDAVALYRRENS